MIGALIDPEARMPASVSGRILDFSPMPGLNRRGRLESETIVLRVRADPEPGDDFALTEAERSMVFADSHDTDAVPPFLEP
jgi:hypothetical protein